MKKFICYIVIGVLLLSSIPSFATTINYNEGPEPTREFYMHFTKVHNDGGYSANVITDDYWIYSYESGIREYLLFDTQAPDKLYRYGLEHRDINDGNSKFWLYKNGDFQSLTSKVVLYQPSEYMPDDLRYTMPEFRDAMNNRLVASNFFNTFWDREDTNEVYVHESTIDVWDSTMTNIVMYPMAPPTPQYEDGSKIWISMGNNSGNNPTAKIIVSYRLDQRTIGNLGDWAFQLNSTPNRNMKVVRHTPLDYLYPQPSLYRYGEIEYQGVNISGTNTFTATASNPVTGLYLQSLPWYNTYYEGFVDENLDGQDDRYNSGDDSLAPIPNDENLLVGGSTIPIRTDYEDGILGTIGYFMDMIFTYISTPFRWIASSLQTMANWLTESMGWINSVNAFFGAFFSYLPQEIVNAMSVLVFMIIIFAIIKVMRG